MSRSWGQVVGSCEEQSGGGQVTQAGLRSPTATGRNGEGQRFTGIADKPAKPLNQ